MLVAVAATGLLLAAAAATRLLLAAAQGGSALPALAWSPTSSGGAYDYGTVDARAARANSVSFTLTNSGGRPSGTLTIVRLDAAAFTITADSCSGRSLGPKKSCGVAVRYAPPANRESDSDTLTATAQYATARITLNGRSGAPDLTLSPGTQQCPSDCSYAADFGLVSAGSSETRRFTVMNGGTGSSEKLRVIFGRDTGFSLAEDKCTGDALAPRATCTFDLAFTSPAGCSAEDFAEQVDVVGDRPSFLKYIHLETVGDCL